MAALIPAGMSALSSSALGSSVLGGLASAAGGGLLSKLMGGGQKTPAQPKTPTAPVTDDKAAMAKRTRELQRKMALVGREGTALSSYSTLG